MSTSSSPAVLAAIGDHLLSWFEDHQRQFPWRNQDLDPFHILTCEMLLRQTRASHVAGVFPLFLDRYPTPTSILAARDEELLELVRPLGLYNQRLRALKAVSGAIVQEHQGHVPAGEDELLDLPHVGLYIARAVQCFAFDEPLAVVDVNALRVISRWFGLDVSGDNRREQTVWLLWQAVIDAAGETVPARDLNWAMLDFAALVCKARSPQCETCPLTSFCLYPPAEQQSDWLPAVAETAVTYQAREG